MAQITLRVLDGADRGRVFERLEAPITIGREEGNTIQLNDERVSRFHLKIQAENDKIVLTDLESTNGTKVNGEDIQLRILRFGDMISLGRSVLIFGTRQQIAQRLTRLRREGFHDGKPKNDAARENDEESLDFDIESFEDMDFQSKLYWLEPPELPDRLSPAQAAQLSELLEYLHIRIRHLLASVHVEGKAQQRINIDAHQWQNLVDMQSRLAEYLRAIGEPQ